MKDSDFFKTLMQHAAAAGVTVTLSVFPNSEGDGKDGADAPETDLKGYDPEDTYAVAYEAVQQPLPSTKFRFGDRVVLITSAALAVDKHEAAQDERGFVALSIQKPMEEGYVIGISVYENGSPPSYLVRYRAGDGRQTETWFSEDAIARYWP